MDSQFRAFVVVVLIFACFIIPACEGNWDIALIIAPAMLVIGASSLLAFFTLMNRR